MARKRLGTCILSGILATVMLVTPSLNWGTNALTSISENKSKQSMLEKKSAQLKSALEAAKNNTEKQAEYQEKLSQQIEVIKQQIDVSNQQILALDNQIAEMQKQIEEKQIKIDDNIELLKKRLRAIYMAGETSTLDIILGAKDFKDFLDKAEIIKTVSKHDSDLIDELTADMESIEKQKSEIESSRVEASEQKKQLDIKREELNSLMEENENVLKELRAEQKAAQDELDLNNEELRNIEREIKEYYKKLEEEAKKQQNQGSIVTPSKGGYAWPVPGFTYLSSVFSEVRESSSHGTYNHGAIDIAGKGIYGAKVVAAADGVVVRANSSGWGGGYGTYLMIDHGNGKSTLYAHMSGLAVSAGDKVSKGQLIGYVGSTGWSTGPHLHFETRLYGTKYDPMTEY